MLKKGMWQMGWYFKGYTRSTGNIAKRILLLCLVFSLSTQALLGSRAQASLNYQVPIVSVPSFSPETNAHMTELYESLEPDEQRVVTDLLLEPQKETAELIALWEKLREKEAKIASHIGEEKLRRQIESRKESQQVTVEMPGVGRAEIAVLGQGERSSPFVKLVHHRTGRAYLAIDLDQTPLEQLERLPDNPTDKEREEISFRKFLAFQMRAYTARQLILAGNNRNEAEIETQSKLKQAMTSSSQELARKAWWKRIWSKPQAVQPIDFETQPLGRDVTIIFHRSGQHVRTEQQNSPRSHWERAYWKNYWYSIWERPGYNEEYWRKGGLHRLVVPFTGDYLLGWFFASAQAVASLGLGLLQERISPDPSLAENTFTALAGTSFAFGILFGVFTKTWQNWSYIGSPMVRSMKTWAVSLSYGIIYGLQVNGVGGMLPFTGEGLNREALHMYFMILSNLIIKGWFKVWSMEIPRFRKLVGETLGEFVIPGTTVNTKIQRAGIDSQLFQLLGTIPKIAHLANMQLYLPGIGNIPIGQLVYPLLIPVFHISTVKYVEGYIREHGGSLWNAVLAEPEARDRNLKAFIQKYEKQFGRNEKNQVVRSPKGAIYKDYEKLAIEYRETWEQSKLFHIPYLRTVINGTQDILHRYIFSPSFKLVKKTGQLAIPGLMFLSINAYTLENPHHSHDFLLRQEEKAEKMKKPKVGGSSNKCKNSLDSLE